MTAISAERWEDAPDKDYDDKVIIIATKFVVDMLTFVAIGILLYALLKIRKFIKSFGMWQCQIDLKTLTLHLTAILLYACVLIVFYSSLLYNLIHKELGTRTCDDLYVISCAIACQFLAQLAILYIMKGFVGARADTKKTENELSESKEPLTINNSTKTLLSQISTRRFTSSSDDDDLSAQDMGLRTSQFKDKVETK
jgi:hypothetical protein